MPYSLFDVGACNCGCAAYPCTLPASNLHLAYLNTANGHTDSCTLVYTAPCIWNGTLSVIGGNWQMLFAAGCTGYTFILAGGSCVYYDHPLHCSGYSAGGCTRLVLTSFTCSPLNIVFTNSTVSWTITL